MNTLGPVFETMSVEGIVTLTLLMVLPLVLLRGVVVLLRSAMHSTTEYRDRPEERDNIRNTVLVLLVVLTPIAVSVLHELLFVPRPA